MQRYLYISRELSRLMRKIISSGQPPDGGTDARAAASLIWKHWVSGAEQSIKVIFWPTCSPWGAQLHASSDWDAKQEQRGFLQVGGRSQEGALSRKRKDVAPTSFCQ